MATLPNMGLITPTLGGDSGAWDDKINAALALIDSHDHTPGKGPLVPVAGLDIDDHIQLGGEFSIAGIYSLDFDAVSDPNTGARRIFVSSNDNELYWRTNAGVNVKLTDGASINTTLVGGIVGDYTSVGAEVAYDDSNKRYTFQNEDGEWTRLASGPVRIYEYLSTESVYVEQAVDAALAASYTVTWPAALPGAAAFVTINASGVVSFTDAPTVAGEITAADFNYTTAQDVIQPAGLWQDPAGSHTKLIGSSGAQIGYTIAASANKLTLPITGLRDGDQITGWTVYVDKRTDNTNTVTARLWAMNDSVTGTETALGTADTNNENAPTFRALSNTGLSTNVISGNQYFIIFTPGAGITPNPDFLLHAFVSVKRP